MPKARCNCGALLRIPDGMDKFRCPQCDRVLRIPVGKLPAGQPAQPARAKIPQIEIGDDDDEVQTELAFQPASPRSGPAPSRPLAPASPAPPDPASPEQAPEPELAEGDPTVGWGRARLFARLQLAVLGLALLFPLIPLEGERAQLDALGALAAEPAGQRLDHLCRLLVVAGGALALIGAALPLGRYRGWLVAGCGLLGGALSLAHLASLPPAWQGKLTLLATAHAPTAILALGLPALLCALLCLAVAQNRAHGPRHGGLKRLGVVSGLLLALFATGLLWAERDHLLGNGRLPAVLGGDAVALYQLGAATPGDETPGDETPGGEKSGDETPGGEAPQGGARPAPQAGALVTMHAVAAGGLLLVGLLSLLSFLETPWLPRISGLLGAGALLVIPAWLVATQAPSWSGGGEIAGVRALMAHLDWIWGPLLLTWLGLRDLLAQSFPIPEPAPAA